jgi:hypothetical protein
VLKNGEYSTKSDVWSFGVLMWEIMEKGAAPYFWMSNAQVSEAVPSGERLPQPDECATELYKLMLSCWHIEPSKRPGFHELLISLQQVHGAMVDTKNNGPTPMATNMSSADEGVYQNDVVYQQQ